jgi:hypothetical protein
MIDPRIGSHLCGTLLSGPLLRRMHQVSANSLTSKLFPHEPAFDEANWLGRIATVSVRAQTHLQKAGQLSALTHSHEGFDRQPADGSVRELPQMILK